MTETALNFRRRQNDKLPAMPHPHDETEPCPGGCEDIHVVEAEVCKYRREVSDLAAQTREGHDQLIRLESRADETGKQMIRLESMLTVNSSKIDKNSSDTAEILQIMHDGEAFFRFARRAGEVLKWTLGIAAAIAAFWVALKGLPK